MPRKSRMQRLRDRNAGFVVSALMACEGISHAALKRDPETALVDFLANARHYCDQLGLDYGAIDRRAYHHYVAELGRGDALAQGAARALAEAG